MSEKDMESFIDSLERTKDGNCSKENLEAESQQVAALWKQLGELDIEEARDDELVSEFKHQLDAYKQGFAEAEQTVSPTREDHGKREVSNIIAFFRYFSVAGVAAALALCGYIAISQTQRNDELSERLANTQETLALALLEQPSAPKRLAGLAAANEVQQPSERLRASMVRTFDSDTNLNVRLAAVSAIARLPKEQALAVLLERMEHEESALVQAEILRQVMTLVGDGSNSGVLNQLESMDLEPRLKTALESKQNRI